MQNTQNGFYNHLRQEYNQQLVTNIKIYKQAISNLKKREIQRKFLLQCRSCNVLPNHISNETKKTTGKAIYTFQIEIPVTPNIF